jgi:predicted nucleotidyltransferase
MTGLLKQDNRVAACWLWGSFGRKSADEVSDVDIGVAVKDDHYEEFIKDANKIISRAGDCLFTWSVNSLKCMHVKGFFSDCNYLDLLISPTSHVRLGNDPISIEEVHILFDKEGILSSVTNKSCGDEKQSHSFAEQVELAVRLFWLYSVAALRYWKRGNLWHSLGFVTAMRGILAKLMWIESHPCLLSDLPLVEWRVRADLSPPLESELESTIVGDPKIVESIQRLIDLFINHSKSIAAQVGCEYPDRLQDAVVNFFQRTKGIYGKCNGNAKA